MMAYFTQRQHIRKRVFASMSSENDMVSLKATIFLPTLLTGVAVAHQTSDNRAGRYQRRTRRFLRLIRRASILSLTSMRCCISPDKRICPSPTQEKPVLWLPLSIPITTSWTCSSHSQSNWIVNGLRAATLALPARNSFRAFAGLQGISLCPFWLTT